MAGVRVVLMVVHSLELHGLPVYQKAFCAIYWSNLYAAESHVKAGVFLVYPEDKGV